jgi:2-C-methyl-D-erythritol 4-phosphate cytidylyltransferase
MNIAIIFAGGTGQRMNSKTIPKQFLELHGKPILAYTIENFQKHPEIDKIILVVLENWIDYCQEMKVFYKFNKLVEIIPGGATGQLSIKNGLECAKKYSDSSETIVLLHDGVRPLINYETISAVIDCTKKNGSAITVAPLTETLAIKKDADMVCDIVSRDKCLLARAPQSFKLNDILSVHEKAMREKQSFIDSASMMRYYGHELFYVSGPVENIKITTPMDFYLFRALLEAKENSQILGLS